MLCGSINGLLVAYVGVPHESSDINGRWVHQFVSGKFRTEWADIVACARQFADLLRCRNYSAAAAVMNREMDIRRRMTPDIVDRPVGLVVEEQHAPSAHAAGSRDGAPGLPIRTEGSSMGPGATALAHSAGESTDGTGSW